MGDQQITELDAVNSGRLANFRSAPLDVWDCFCVRVPQRIWCLVLGIYCCPWFSAPTHLIYMTDSLNTPWFKPGDYVEQLWYVLLWMTTRGRQQPENSFPALSGDSGKLWSCWLTSLNSVCCVKTTYFYYVMSFLYFFFSQASFLAQV